MIIQCGKRRLCSYAYGWRIEIQHVTKSGAIVYREDRPAYPASLAQACENLLERELADGPDLTIDQLPEALKTATATVRKYLQQAREAA